MADEIKKPEEKPSLKAMQLLGIAAALAPAAPPKDKIPDGYECTSCRERAMHAVTCAHPRGFRRVSP